MVGGPGVNAINGMAVDDASDFVAVQPSFERRAGAPQAEEMSERTTAKRKSDLEDSALRTAEVCERVCGVNDQRLRNMENHETFANFTDICCVHRKGLS